MEEKLSLAGREEGEIPDYVRGWMEQAVTKEIHVIQDGGISNEVEIKFIPKTFPTKSRQYSALLLFVGEEFESCCLLCSIFSTQCYTT